VDAQRHLGSFFTPIVADVTEDGLAARLTGGEGQ